MAAKTPPYSLLVTGSRSDRGTLLGSILVASIDKTTTVENGYGRASIPFQYKGDARFVLRRAAAALSECRKNGADRIIYGEAEARIVKTA